MFYELVIETMLNMSTQIIESLSGMASYYNLTSNLQTCMSFAPLIQRPLTIEQRKMSYYFSITQNQP